MHWLVMIILAQGDCTDRRPGLSKCVTYERRGDKVDCRAACYTVSKPDGGTKGDTVKAAGYPSEDACRTELLRQATNGCKP